MSLRLRLISWLTSPLLLTLIPSLLPIPSYLFSSTVQGQTNQDRKTQADKLLRQGNQQFQHSQYRDAIQSWQQALVIYQQLKDRKGETNSLNNLGNAYNQLGQYPKAIEFYQQVLTIVQGQESFSEVETLSKIGLLYKQLGQYTKAVYFYEKSLSISQHLSDLLSGLNPIAFYESLSLQIRLQIDIGNIYADLGDYAKAIQSFEQSLDIANKYGDQKQRQQIIINFGKVYAAIGDYIKAFEYLQQSLKLAREIGDRQGELEALATQGSILALTGNTKGLNSLQQSLLIAREVKDKKYEGVILNNIGLLYHNRSEFSKSIDFYHQALSLYKEINDQIGIGEVFNNLGVNYVCLSKYALAMDFFQQGLIIFKTVKSQNGIGATLNNLGLLYSDLGKYNQALNFYEQALEIRIRIGNLAGQAATLNNIGLVYDYQRQFPKAISFYQQSLTIRRNTADQAGQAVALNNIGLVYSHLGQFSAALQSLEQALGIFKQLKNPVKEGNTLDSLGTVYKNLKMYDQAFAFYQKALVIMREVGDHSTEKVTLSNIGSLFQELKKPKLAIIFYKKSVNLTEAIRKDLQTLPRDQQESYTQTVADTYRSLADLLLSQGRVLEAQQVLELLKIQELRDFTRNAIAGGETAGIALSRIEENILNKYGTLIAFGLKLYECEQQKCNILSQLRDQLDTLTQQFNQDTNTFRKTLQERLAKDPALLEPEQVRNTAAKIVTAEPDTILVYPLVLKDKIRILLATRAGEKGVVFRTFETPVNQQQLWNKVSQFRTKLSNPNGEKELKAISQELYNWLIKPLEGEIKDKNVRHLVFSLDRSTRYIPMAALFDGKQYLIERYGISTVLNAGLTDVKDRLPSKKQDIKVLAMGVSKAFPGFNALSNVPLELANIVQKSGKENTGIFPGLEFLNEAFIFRTLRDNLSGNKILHIATHGKFESGRPENSFLLSGTGEELKIDQIQTLQNYMTDTHLVVLSACETALGGVDADGIEMSGISFYFLTNGAKAVIASLWLVNDASTSQLMQQFYQNLSTGKMTKSQALREAQIAMIQGKIQSGAVNRSSVNYTPGQSRNSESISRNLSHPYYWSPFILIGNGL
ncbi:MAG: tetratricopeptide repeat protein [Nostocales cyanobacterium LE14-WE4]|nr:tetratricopeptide repeat protein [Nostocales cyanobacterium LE14-WE4]